jgi:hypothetical protein
LIKKQEKNFSKLGLTRQTSDLQAIIHRRKDDDNLIESKLKQIMKPKSQSTQC